MALNDDWIAIRNKYKGHTVSSSVRRFFGAYVPNSGTLERLNVAVEAQSRSPNEANLITVHQCIEAVARSEKVEKYGLALAELLMKVPRRPAKLGMSNVAQELLSFFAEVQESAAARVFSVDPTPIPGRAVRGPINVRWKEGTIASLTNACKNWSAELKEVAAFNAAHGDGASQLAFDVMSSPTAARELATGVFGLNLGGSNAADRDDALNVRLAALKTINAAREQSTRIKRRNAIVLTQDEASRLRDSLAPVSSRSDLQDAAIREATLLMPAIVESTVDIYECVRGGVEEGLDGSFQDSLATLADTAIEGSEVNQQVIDAAVSALGNGLACLGLATGIGAEVKAAFLAYGAHRANQMVSIVPFGTASSAVIGVRDLLTRYARHNAADGAIDIVSGSLALAGTGPLGGIAGAGVKIIISVHTALENAREVQAARTFLAHDSGWFKERVNVMDGIRKSPLLGAYFIQQCDSSDLIGYLTDAELFREELIQSQVESLIPQLELLRNLANECQLSSSWGIEGLNGWMRNLDTRLLRQPAKLMYNTFQDFKKADLLSIDRRVAGVA
jgi:hypothetical protein